MKVTPAQRRVLEIAAKHELGLVTSLMLGATTGFGSRSRRLMFNRLREAGLLKPYLHGGYEITDAGRAALSPLKPD